MTKYLLRFIFLFTSIAIKAQLTPAIEWQSITWEGTALTGSAQTQAQSADEWWFSHKNVYNSSGVHTGYAMVGYLGWVYTPATFSLLQAKFNEGSNSCYNPYLTSPNFNAPDCAEREYSGAKRSEFEGNTGLFDLNGNMVWCEEYCVGDLEEVVQSGNFLYVIGNHKGVKSIDKTAFLNYNPTSSNPNNNFDLTANATLTCSTNLGTGHIYIAKLDMAGNVIWQNLYGFPDYNTNKNQAMNSKSIGYDLIVNSNGSLYAVGQGETSIGSPVNAIILRIDTATGYLISKSTLPFPSVLNVHGQPVKELNGKSIVEIGNSTNMAIAALGFFNVPNNYSDAYRAFVYSVDQNLGLNSGWTTNPVGFASTGGNKKSNVWEINYHKKKNELLVGVIADCINCDFAGNNYASGKIYRLLPNGTLSTAGTNPMLMGNINAYDLRLGVVEDKDKGFVAVSSTNNNVAFIPPTPAELGYLFPPDPNCVSSITDGYNYWDTDPVVVKFDSMGNLKWRKVFDVIPGRPRQPPPGDLKRQECMYKVSQAGDGGYVISGNCSYNFDDNYVVKLAPDTLLGVEELMALDKQVKVYPNPCRDKLLIEWYGASENSQIHFELAEAATGRVVKRSILSSSTNTIMLDGLSEGVFILSLHDGRQTVYKKIVHLK